MKLSSENHIRRELEKRFPDLDDDFDEGGSSRTYQKIREIYDRFDDPEAWKLVEMLDADTLESKWHWVKKS